MLHSVSEYPSRTLSEQGVGHLYLVLRLNGRMYVKCVDITLTASCTICDQACADRHRRCKIVQFATAHTAAPAKPTGLDACMLKMLYF